jgi:pimeloyl-ACP methyl ester carboxylesterase
VSRYFIASGLRGSFSNARLVPEAMIERKFDLMNAEGRSEEAALMIRQYVRGDPVRVLGHVLAPVLVLWGGAEKSLSQETADAFASAVRNARAVRKVIQPSGGHMMHVELAEPTAKVVAAFLDEFPPDLPAR